MKIYRHTRYDLSEHEQARGFYLDPNSIQTLEQEQIFKLYYGLVHLEQENLCPELGEIAAKIDLTKERKLTKTDKREIKQTLLRAQETAKRLKSTLYQEQIHYCLDKFSNCASTNRFNQLLLKAF